MEVDEDYRRYRESRREGRGVGIGMGIGKQN